MGKKRRIGENNWSCHGELESTYYFSRFLKNFCGCVLGRRPVYVTVETTPTPRHKFPRTGRVVTPWDLCRAGTSKRSWKRSRSTHFGPLSGRYSFRTAGPFDFPTLLLEVDCMGKKKKKKNDWGVGQVISLLLVQKSQGRYLSVTWFILRQ